jgi:hypothetical protein
MFSKEANRLKMRGISYNDWKTFSSKYKLKRYHDVYNHNIPDPLKAFNNEELIKEFIKDKDWSHVISKKNGVENGLSVEELSQAKNGIFECSSINRARGSRNMSFLQKQWGNFKNFC